MPRLSRRVLLAGGAGAALLPGAAASAGVQAADLTSLRGQSWRSLQRYFSLERGLVYLNNGTLGPCPRPVTEVVHQAWRVLEQNPAEQGYGPLLEQAEAVRAEAARFLGCGVDEVAITRSTTEGMSAIAQGLHLRPGDRVLTTDQEHPGGRVCWDYLARHGGISIDAVRLPKSPADPATITACFEAALTPQTRVISVSHVSYCTGLRLPIPALAALAEAHGALLVVDGAQAPGVLAVEVRALGCHAYATSAHKWMLAPKGTGLLYLSEKARERIAPPLLQHGNAVYTAATGTRDLAGILGLGAAIRFLTAIGQERIERRAFQLRAVACEALSRIPGVRLVSSPGPEFASALVVFALPEGVDSTALAAALRDRHRVIVRVVPPEVANGLRISFHLYNDEEQIARLVRALRTELGGTPG